MANQFTRLLLRRSEMDAAEFELLQSRVIARLMRRRPDGEGAPPPDAAPTNEAPPQDESPATEEPAAEVAQRDAGDDDGKAVARKARYISIRASTYELPENAVGVMAEPSGDAQNGTKADDGATPAEAGVQRPPPAEGTADTQPSSGNGSGTNGGPTGQGVAKTRGSNGSKGATTTAGRARTGQAARSANPTVGAGKPPASGGRPAKDGSLKTPPATPAPAVSAMPSTPTVAAVPYCPYCALRLDPPPRDSRRCTRCRQRIIVKRVDGRPVYLTEASVAVFDAERQRRANMVRWTRDRPRWLKAAAGVGAPAAAIAKLDRTPISEDSVAASRALYVTTVETAVRAAKDGRRWEDASRMLRDHAMTLFRIAGSPIPPPEDVLQPHREAAAAALRGIADLARSAELVSGRCCEICKADDGRMFRIDNELRTPRLPHLGCPKGLCRCDWYLAVSDQSLVLRHVRRRARAGASTSRKGG